MSAKEIDAFYETHQALYAYLLAERQVSFANEVSNNFRRSLVLAIASHFEHEVAGIMRQLPVRYAASHPFISELLEQKAIAFQYHTYFEWDGRNANRFFRLFGVEFRDSMKVAIQADRAVDDSVKAFLELGNLRNRLVHLNYVTFDVDKSPEDIIGLYHLALRFIGFLRVRLLGKEE